MTDLQTIIEAAQNGTELSEDERRMLGQTAEQLLDDVTNASVGDLDTVVMAQHAEEVVKLLRRIRLLQMRMDTDMHEGLDPEGAAEYAEALLERCVRLAGADY